MKKLIMTVVALMGATALFAQTDVVATFQQATANAKAGNYAEAIAQFEAVVEAGWDIDEPDANQLKAIQGSKKFIVTCYNKMGVAAVNAKEYEAAIEHFTNAANTAEIYEDAAAMNKNRTMIGQVYQVQGADAFNSGDYATSIAVFSQGYAADPRNTEMALNLAESYFRSDMYQEGMKICTKIAGMNADSSLRPSQRHSQRWICTQTTRLLSSRWLTTTMALSLWLLSSMTLLWLQRSLCRHTTARRTLIR